MNTYMLGNEEVFLQIDKYQYTDNTSLYAYCVNGEPYGSLSVNFEKLESDDLVYLNVNLFGVNVEKFIVDNKLGMKVNGRERQSVYVKYPLYRLFLARIKS